MPVEAVAVHVEGHRVQHVVDRGDHLHSKEQTTTSEEGQQTDIFFRHFQVKLSEPSETELSILLALATLSFL